MNFDVNYDHRLDSGGKDPDTHSQTLKAQHQILWSKPLPDSTVFTLENEPNKYLQHKSALGVFHISSDTISHSLRAQKRMSPIISQIPSADLDEFQSVGSVIGARIIFSGNRVDGHATINQARGMNIKINDRFDLTLECIRLHYLGLSNPLEKTISNYSAFFKLFRDFDGYVDFFLLQDLFSQSSGNIRFYLPHDSSFGLSPRPDSVESYYQYMSNTINFVKARNQRMQAWADLNLG